MKIVKIVLLAFFLSSGGYALAQANDEITRMEAITEHKIVERIQEFVQNHFWCLSAIVACLGYVHVATKQSNERKKSLDGSMSLAEALERIAELEKALEWFGGRIQEGSIPTSFLDLIKGEMSKRAHLPM